MSNGTPFPRGPRDARLGARRGSTSTLRARTGRSGGPAVDIARGVALEGPERARWAPPGFAFEGLNARG